MAILFAMNDITKDELLSRLRTDAVLLGVGNGLSGDDGFGPQLVKRLRPVLGERAIDGGLAPENWAGPIIKLAPETLIIADAVAFGGEPGEIRVLEPEDLEQGIPATHGPGFGMLVAYLREIAPSITITILAVQPVATGLGRPISEPIKRAIDRLAGLVENDF